MKLLRTLLAELVGLFVDDRAFALLVLLWIGLFTLPGRHNLGAWGGPALFAGPAVFVLAFVVRAAQKNKSG